MRVGSALRSTEIKPLFPDLWRKQTNTYCICFVFPPTQITPPGPMYRLVIMINVCLLCVKAHTSIFIISKPGARLCACVQSSSRGRPRFVVFSFMQVCLIFKAESLGFVKTMSLFSLKVKRTHRHTGAHAPCARHSAGSLYLQSGGPFDLSSDFRLKGFDLSSGFVALKCTGAFTTGCVLRRVITSINNATISLNLYVFSLNLITSR